jgi:PEGA domain
MIRKWIILPVIFFVVLSGCVAEKPPESGAISFTSSPSGAMIYLDSQFRGNTPGTVTGIEPGNHTLEFRYPGYASWSTVMGVSPGPNNVFVALSPQAGSIPGTGTTTTPSPASPVSVTVQTGKESMVIGDSMLFSGTAYGCDHVLLTLYGPGSYANGVLLSQPKVDALDSWGYTWNPGSAVLPGTFTVLITDPNKGVSDKKEFSVTGGGQVTVISNSYAAARGDTLRFSGICTTGARNVDLVLYGPGQYAGGVDLGTFSVMADMNWNFRYTLDNSMPTGLYRIYVYDVPKTTSGTAQFTVGFAGT